VPPVVTIRDATPDDAPMLAELGFETFVETYEEQVERAVLVSFAETTFTPRRTLEELATPGSRFLVADSNGAVAGYALIRTGNPPPAVRAARPVELGRIYVRSSFIGLGVGAALMRASLDDAAGRIADAVWLGVWSLNERAIGFYRRWGFEAVSTVEFDLGEITHEDLVMVRRLGGPSGPRESAVRHG
jgi:ribosomal protein S18 acetylase RimI-like enzyme